MLFALHQSVSGETEAFVGYTGGERTYLSIALCQGLLTCLRPERSALEERIRVRSFQFPLLCSYNGLDHCRKLFYHFQMPYQME